MARTSTAAGAPGPLGSLVGILELHDLSYTYQIPPLVRLLADEAELVPDLRRARPWLEAGPPEEVLQALLDEEWTGFVARLGRAGPWVYAPSVADLQALSAAYTRLAQVAQQSDLTGVPADSLLGRLQGQLNPPGGRPPEPARREEAAFWTFTQAQASTQREAWASRRRGP